MSGLTGLTAFRLFRDQAAITRQDLLVDCYDELPPVDIADSEWCAGLFTTIGPGLRGVMCRGRDLGSCPAAVAARSGRGRPIDWDVSVYATIARAHQHATNTTSPDQDTGGSVELQKLAARAG